MEIYYDEKINSYKSIETNEIIEFNYIKKNGKNYLTNADKTAYIYYQGNRLNDEFDTAFKWSSNVGK